MKIESYRQYVQSTVGTDPATAYPELWHTLEHEQTDAAMAALINQIGRNPDIDASTLKGLHRQWRRLHASPADAHPLTPAMHFGRADAIVSATIAFLSAGAFTPTSKRFFRTLQQKLTANPRLLLKLEALTERLQQQGQSILLRRDIHIFFMELGLDYRIAYGMIAPADTKSITVGIARSDRLIEMHESAMEHLVSWMARGRLDIDVAGVAPRIWDALERGNILERNFDRIIFDVIPRLETGELPGGPIRKALEGILRKAGYELRFDDDARGFSISTVKMKIAPIPRRDLRVRKSQTHPFSRIPNMPVEAIFRHLQHDSPSGNVVTQRLGSAQTQIHFPVTATTPIDGDRFDPVPPDAKVIALWFHGTSVRTAHGGNIWGEMNLLASYGIAPIGFDYPFHGQGPCDARLADADAFAEWVHGIVAPIRERHPDKKVLFFGHSFGPGAILNALSLHPEDADAAILLAPTARVSKRLREHHRRVVQPYLADRYTNFQGVSFNFEGDRWAEQVMHSQRFMQRAPSSIRMRTIIGANDHYYPDRAEALQLAQHFPGMSIHLVPGLDHYLFGNKVQDLPANVRDEIFIEQPPHDDTRLIVWTIIDFLRSTFDNIVPRVPNAPNKRLDPAREALWLSTVNPVFRALAPKDGSLRTPARAQDFIAAWHSEKRRFIDQLLQSNEPPPGLSPDQKKRLDRFRSAIADSTMSPRRLNTLRRQLLPKWIRAYTQNRTSTSTAPTDFQTRLHGALDSVGKNQWSFALHVQLNIAAMRARTASKSLELLPAIAAREAIMQIFSEEMGEYANRVLATQIGGDILSALRLFRDTKHIIALGTEPSSPPEAIAKKLTVDRFAKALRCNAYGGAAQTPSVAQPSRIENLVAAIAMALPLGTVRGLFSFTLTPEGRKRYLDSHRDADTAEPVHTEIRFGEGKTERTLDLLAVKKGSLPLSVRRFLDTVGIEGAVTGSDDIDATFSDQPDAAHAYAREHGLPLAYADGLVVKAWNFPESSPRPFAGVGSDGEESRWSSGMGVFEVQDLSLDVLDDIDGLAPEFAPWMESSALMSATPIWTAFCGLSH